VLASMGEIYRRRERRIHLYHGRSLNERSHVSVTERQRRVRDGLSVVRHIRSRYYIKTIGNNEFEVDEIPAAELTAETVSRKSEVTFCTYNNTNGGQKMKSGCQIYVKNSLEAVALYIKAFNLTSNPNMTAFNDDGTYEHVSLMSGENEIVAVAENSDNAHSSAIKGGKVPSMAFNVYDLGTREAVDHAFVILSEKARINQNPNGPEVPFWNEDGTEYWFGLVDKFGIFWSVGK